MNLINIPQVTNLLGKNTPYHTIPVGIEYNY